MQVKTLIFTFLCAVVGATSCQQNNPQKPTESTASASAETLPWATDIDLVCEMKVDKTADDTVHYNGKIYGFCNPHCKEQFQENPTKFGAK